MSSSFQYFLCFELRSFCRSTLDRSFAFRRWNFCRGTSTTTTTFPLKNYPSLERRRRRQCQCRQWRWLLYFTFSQLDFCLFFIVGLHGRDSGLWVVVRPAPHPSKEGCSAQLSFSLPLSLSLPCMCLVSHLFGLSSWILGRYWFLERKQRPSLSLSLHLSLSHLHAIVHIYTHSLSLSCNVTRYHVRVINEKDVVFDSKVYLLISS